MSEPPSNKTTLSSGSLLSPAAIGGIVAGKGFDFQTRYAVCHLPVWLQDDAFHQVFFEGTGDIDIRYVDGEKSTRKHIQVKDHEVTPSEFKEVIDSFQATDNAFPGVYQKFILACPSLSPQLRSIENGLARLRGAASFYDDMPSALSSTKNDADERMRKHGLTNEQIEFIHEKIRIEIGHGDLVHEDRALELFVVRLLNHPEFAGKIRAMVQPAFSEVFRTINASKGSVLHRTALESVLRSSVLADNTPEKSVTVWIQNWTKEVFEPPADFQLDWSASFDRITRKVPPSDVWDNELIPQLDDIRKQIMATGPARTIRLRGKCALSTGVAIGATFPAVGGWTFEMPQPPMRDHWRSDAIATPDYDLQVEIIDVDPGGDDIVVGLNVRGDGRKEIEDFIATTGKAPNAIVYLSPPTRGAQSIGGAEDACGMARAVRHKLGEILKSRRLRATRLFVYGPLALSIFLGQQLTSMGKIHLFEYQDPGYVPSCTLTT